MARFYSNENIPAQLVLALRRMGHDVLTSLEAGNANLALPDAHVLAFATDSQRIVLTNNRRHFLQLHVHRSQPHAGIVLITYDRDYVGQAQRIQLSIEDMTGVTDQLVRVNRPA